MNSKSNFSLVLGIILLLASPAFAGEITDWVNNDNVLAGTAPSIAGLTVSGIGMAQSAEMRRRANKRLRFVTRKEDLEKQFQSAEREYQIEKENLEKAIKASRELSQSRKVLSLDLVRQRKNYEKALAKYNNLQHAYNTLGEALSKNYGAVAKMRALAQKDLKTAEHNSLVSKIGMIISIPVGTGIGAMSAIVRDRTPKATTSGANASDSQITADSMAANKSAE